MVKVNKRHIYIAPVLPHMLPLRCCCLRKGRRTA